MAELLFTDINPAEFIFVPKGALADFLPPDAERLRDRVANAVMHAPMPDLLTADKDCPYRRLDDQTDPHEVVEELKDWQKGLWHLRSDLSLVDLYINPHSTTAGDPEVVDRFLNLAYQEYTGMVEQANAVKRVRPDKAAAALATLAADLISVDYPRSWMWWNGLAQGYQLRKIRFIDELIRSA